ncbi:MAG: AEC family transporter [Clostridiales bacterium]|nr:AEC family transporter [Clostridiales bacterium]
MFLSNMALAAQQVLILYVIVAVGFVADRLGVFVQTTAKLSNNLLFYVVTPSVIIQSFLTMDFSPDSARALLTAFICAVGTSTLGVLLSLPFFNKCADKAPIFKYAVAYGNMGYMALPLANAVLGAEGVFYCSAGVIAFNIFSFTHGVWLMNQGGAEKVKFKLRTLILNPGVISVIIGLPMFIFSVKLPAVVRTPLDYIASLNTPLAMLFFGTYIANTDFKSMFKDRENYLSALLKLIVMPLVMLGVFKLCGIGGTLLTACIISASAPSANNTVMFSAKYGKDTGTASKAVAFVSAVSIVTMPFMIALSKSV